MVKKILNLRFSSRNLWWELETVLLLTLMSHLLWLVCACGQQTCTNAANLINSSMSWFFFTPLPLRFRKVSNFCVILLERTTNGVKMIYCDRGKHFTQQSRWQLNITNKDVTLREIKCSCRKPFIFDSCTTSCVSQIQWGSLSSRFRRHSQFIVAQSKRAWAASWSLIYSIPAARLQLAYSCLPNNLVPARDADCMLLSLLGDLYPDLPASGCADLQHECWTLGRSALSVDITLCFSWSCFTAVCLVRNQRSQTHIIFFTCGSQDTNLLAVKDFGWCDRLIIRCFIHTQVINKHQRERNF